MSLVSPLRQRGARSAFVLVLVAITVLGVAAMASAVEPDGGIGD